MDVTATDPGHGHVHGHGHGHAHGHGPANRRRRVLRTAAPLFVCEPATPTGRGAIVLHDVAGMTEYVEEICRRMAAHDRLVAAPYHYYGRGGPAFDDGQEASAWAELGRVTPDDLMADVRGALDYLDRRRAGQALVVGFGLGGYLATWAAAHLDLGMAVAIEPWDAPLPGMPALESLMAARRSPWREIQPSAIDEVIDA